MGKKVRLICSVVGLVGCLLQMVICIMNIAGVEFPKPLWLVAAILLLVNVVSIILNYIEVKKNNKKDIESNQ